MKYIINMTIVFDPGGRELLLVNNNQLSMGLSKPATRLLSELIKNNNVDLSRDMLIKRVWQDYGFSPSNASLNNHISELRKAFESVGGNKDIIVTVPRLGFRMEAEIHPVVAVPQDVSDSVQQAESNNPIEDDATKVIDSFPLEGAQEKRKRPKGTVFFLITGLISFIIAMAIALIVFANRDVISVSATQNKCNIYSIEDSNPSTDLAEKAKKMIVEEGIDCSREEADIYYIEARPANEFLRVYFMAVCTKNDAMNTSYCTNYKLIE